MIISFCQIKGGVGKTTLAVNTAIELSRRGGDVLLVDADDQSTASDFTALRGDNGEVGYTMVELSGANVRKQILKLAPKHDHVVIDVGGRDTAALRAALTVSDAAIIPVQPRSFDMWALEMMEELIGEVRAFNPDLAAMALVNFRDPQGNDNAEAASELREKSEMTYLDAGIGRRKAFANAASLGLGVVEMTSRDSKAINELKFMVDKIIEEGGEGDHADHEKTAAE